MIKLSPDVRRVWRRFSFNAMGWGLAFLAWWVSDAAPDLKATIGTKNAMYIIGGLLVAGMVGSCIDQPKARAPKERQL